MENLSHLPKITQLGMGGVELKYRQDESLVHAFNCEIMLNLRGLVFYTALTLSGKVFGTSEGLGYFSVEV